MPDPERNESPNDDKARKARELDLVLREAAKAQTDNHGIRVGDVLPGYTHLSQKQGAEVSIGDFVLPPESICRRTAPILKSAVGAVRFKDHIEVVGAAWLDVTKDRYTDITSFLVDHPSKSESVLWIVTSFRKTTTPRIVRLGLSLVATTSPSFINTELRHALLRKGQRLVIVRLDHREDQ